MYTRTILLISMPFTLIIINLIVLHNIVTIRTNTCRVKDILLYTCQQPLSLQVHVKFWEEAAIDVACIMTQHPPALCVIPIYPVNWNSEELEGKNFKV